MYPNGNSVVEKDSTGNVPVMFLNNVILFDLVELYMFDFDIIFDMD